MRKKNLMQNKDVDNLINLIRFPAKSGLTVDKT